MIKHEAADPCAAKVNTYYGHMPASDSFLPSQGLSVDPLVDGSGPIIAGYRDPSSGYRFVVAEPAEQPSLWHEYLHGAVCSYRKHGVESVLEYEEVVDGNSTAMFFVALDAQSSVVGGMRVQGCYHRVEQAHAMQEWAGRAGTQELRREITDRLPDGVIEMKTGWVGDEVGRRDQLTNALARIFVHSLRLTGARYALGTVAQHAVPRWRTTGGAVSEEVAPVAYPTPRYRTVPMWWDRETFADLAAPEQLPFILDEMAQLADSVASDAPAAGRGAVGVRAIPAGSL